MTDEAMSPLRRRMIEDMSIRKFAPKTQHDYVQRVKDFAAFLGRSPDAATLEDVRSFQLRLTSSGAGTPKINATVSALRFFFNVTLDRPDLARHLSFVHVRSGRARRNWPFSPRQACGIILGRQKTTKQTRRQPHARSKSRTQAPHSLEMKPSWVSPKVSPVHHYLRMKPRMCRSWSQSDFFSFT